MKNALIIGGSSGIGFDTAQRLAARNVAVTITGRDPAKLSRASIALQQIGPTKIRTRVIDLYDQAHVDGFARELATDTPFDYLVNSAGYFRPTPFLGHTRADYRQYLDLNESFFLVTQAVVGRLVEQKLTGSIVNIGSMWGHQAVKATPSSAYSMAKAGLHSFTQH